jgi:two-component system phosphate regulon sensor histidine kinase PhoR
MSEAKHSLWLSYVLSAAVVIIALLAAAWYATDRFHEFFIDHLKNTLKSRAITVGQTIEDSHINEKVCDALRLSDPTIRVTVVNKPGTVLCDSEVDHKTMENHAKRPEISKALTGKDGSVTRFSDTLKMSMLYVAIPYYESSEIDGVVRTAIPLVSVDELFEEFHQKFLVLMVIILIVVSIVSIRIFHKIRRSMLEITDKANLFAQGDFAATIPDYEIREVAELSMALNHMAKQLNRLENLRQDFVANVSHELKTPVATIKGYVETLLDGSQHDPEDIENFLRIILKQNNRLAAIIDDLLTLSRLESAPATQLLELVEHDACDVLQSSADICQARANAKGIMINVTCESPISIRIDYSLMTQAMVNLLDNAIKYSYANTQITFSAEVEDNQVLICVCDQGPGIPEEHLPRLFERFYRVDKSRSRRVGGTGLGLAIVKHIVQVHKGNIEVVNNPGAGCCFIITLPTFVKF